MSQAAPTLSPSARLLNELAALKHAAGERRHLGNGTAEYAEALETELRLTERVYELASQIRGEGLPR